MPFMVVISIGELSNPPILDTESYNEFRLTGFSSRQSTPCFLMKKTRGQWGAKLKGRGSFDGILHVIKRI